MGSRQSAIIGFWDIVAPFYESHPGNTAALGSEAHHRWIRLFEQMLPGLPADVLDVCTGTGFAALICAGLGHRVIGTDLSIPMLQAARQMAQERDIQAEFIEADAVDPPFEPMSFDVITCRYALWTLTRADQALRNRNRLLRPGGRIIVVDAFRTQDDGLDPEQEKVFSDHYTPDVRASLQFMHLENEDALLRALADADFNDVRFDRMPKVNGESDDHQHEYVVVAYRMSL